MVSGWGVWWELGIWNLGFDVEWGLWQGSFRCYMAGHGLYVGLYKAG